MPNKPFYQSSTLWINAIGILLVILPFVVTLPVVSQDKDLVAILLGVINIANRFRSAPKANLTLT